MTQYTETLEELKIGNRIISVDVEFIVYSEYDNDIGFYADFEDLEINYKSVQFFNPETGSKVTRLMNKEMQDDVYCAVEARIYDGIENHEYTD